MKEPVFEKCMCTDVKSYKMSIRAWVCIQNATTSYKRAPQLILPNYETLRQFILNKFPSRCDGCFHIRSEKQINRLINEFRWKMTNHLYIPITLRIYLTGNSILRWSVRTAIATNKFACSWWPFSILVLLHCGLFFKTSNRQRQKN